tara:strand:- start:351 stop:761 length:411 start_codon:yes stop_codon:yes gene_type:complete
MKLKQLVSEAKFAVEVEGLGAVIVDGSSEGEVRSRVAKKLKGGREAIKGVRKITKDKAGKASKAIGEELPLYSDYQKQHKETAAIEAAYDEENRLSTGPDASGKGETRNQRGSSTHARGKKKRPSKWIKPNPFNDW